VQPGLTRLHVGGKWRDVWKVGPHCVKRWQPAISPATVQAKCRLSRRHPDFARRWYVPWLHWSVGPWISAANHPRPPASNRFVVEKSPHRALRRNDLRRQLGKLG
jgi:hypothetical protein